MARGHIRIKSGDGWSAGLGCCLPRGSLASGKYYGRPRAERPRGLPTYFSLARSLRGGKAVDMKLDALDELPSAETGACFVFPSHRVHEDRDGIVQCVCNCCLRGIYPAITLQSSELRLASFFALCL